jgi:hypothetical protein
MEAQTGTPGLSHTKHTKRGRMGCPAGPGTPKTDMQNMQNQVGGDYCIFCRRVFSYFLEALTQWNISVFDSSGFPPSRE